MSQKRKPKYVFLTVILFVIILSFVFLILVKFPFLFSFYQNTTTFLDSENLTLVKSVIIDKSQPLEIGSSNRSDLVYLRYKDSIININTISGEKNEQPLNDNSEAILNRTMSIDGNTVGHRSDDIEFALSQKVIDSEMDLLAIIYTSRVEGFPKKRYPNKLCFEFYKINSEHKNVEVLKKKSVFVGRIHTNRYRLLPNIEHENQISLSPDGKYVALLARGASECKELKEYSGKDLVLIWKIGATAVPVQAISPAPKTSRF